MSQKSPAFNLKNYARALAYVLMLIGLPLLALKLLDLILLRLTNA